MKISKEQFPVDWNVELLDYHVQKGDIKLDRGKVISSIMINKNPGTFPVYSSSAKGNALFGTWGNYLIDEELISWSVDGGGYFFYRPKHKFSVTNVSGLLRVDSSKFDIRFLYYFLDWQHSSQTYNYQDKAHPSVIRRKYFVSQAEISEQRKIAHILITLDQTITYTEQLIAKFKRIKTGLLYDLFSKGIDEKANLRNEQTHQFKDSLLGRIPVEWECKPLGEIKNFITSGSRNWARFYSTQGALFLRITNLTRENINFELDDIKRVNVQNSDEGKRTKLQEGDILISITADLGIIGIIPETFEEAYINQHIALFRIREREEYDPRFIGHFLSSYFGQEQFIKLNSGGAKAGLNLPTILNLNFPKMDLSEQKMISLMLDKSDETISKHKFNLSKLQSLKTGLMQDLLSGKVRLPEELLLREGIE